MISGPAARQAFDIDKEEPRLRDRYGQRNCSWGPVVFTDAAGWWKRA